MMRCESIVRNPVTIRLVTNSVLMVSDLDIVFSWMFTYTLVATGGLGFFFGSIILLGQALYLVGALYFAPRNKFQTMDIVKGMMKSCPDEFKCGFTQVTEMSTVMRGANSRSNFASLQHNDIDYEQFKAGIASYELMHMWTAAECRNAKNCAKLSHGCPFYRLAAYGYMAEPTASDLGGILNTNALYSFAVGLPQLAFGVYLFTQASLTLTSILPLSISMFSLFLSLTNIVCDFAGVLAQLDEETRLRDDILNKSSAALEQSKKELNRERDERERQIQEKFQGRNDSVAMAQKAAMLKESTDTYARDLDLKSSQNLEVVQVNLELFRDRVNAIKLQLRGRRVQKPSDTENPIEAFKRKQAPLLESKNLIDQEYTRSVEAINQKIATVPSTVLKQELDEAARERDARLSIINEQLERLNGGQMLGRPSPTEPPSMQ